MATSESGKNGDSWWSYLGAIGVILLVFHWADYAWHSKLRYSVQYSVRYDQVTVANQPHNCEWLAAPLGDKNCHYDPQVQIIRTATSTTGKPIVSYDDGKAWSANDGIPPITPAVYVTWQKIED